MTAWGERANEVRGKGYPQWREDSSENVPNKTEK